MKIYPSLFLFLFFCHLLLAENEILSKSPDHSFPAMAGGMATVSITAADYCTFLNATAMVDEHQLYNEAISSDPAAACIVRLGEPGAFHYEVIAGREEMPVMYVTLLAQEYYKAWVQYGEPAGEESIISFYEESDAESLGCNRIEFSTNIPDSTLSLAGTTTYFNDFINASNGFSARDIGGTALIVIALLIGIDESPLGTKTISTKMGCRTADSESKAIFPTKIENEQPNRLDNQNQERKDSAGNEELQPENQGVALHTKNLNLVETLLLRRAKILNQINETSFKSASQSEFFQSKKEPYLNYLQQVHDSSIQQACNNIVNLDAIRTSNALDPASRLGELKGKTDILHEAIKKQENDIADATAQIIKIKQLENERVIEQQREKVKDLTGKLSALNHSLLPAIYTSNKGLLETQKKQAEKQLVTLLTEKEKMNKVAGDANSQQQPIDYQITESFNAILKQKEKELEKALSETEESKKALQNFKPTQFWDEYAAALEFYYNNNEKEVLQKKFNESNKQSELCDQEKKELEHCRDILIERLNPVPNQNKTNSNDLLKPSQDKGGKRPSSNTEILDPVPNQNTTNNNDLFKKYENMRTRLPSYICAYPFR